MDDLQLYYGDDLNLYSKMMVRHPKLKDIKVLGYELYQKFVSCLILKPIDIADILWFENKLWYEDINEWNFFLSNFNSDDNVKDAIKWFTGRNFEIANSEEDNSFGLYDEENNVFINEWDFIEFSEYIRRINFISDENELNLGGNKKTKIFMLKQLYKKRKKKQKELVNIPSMVSSVDCKRSNSEDIFNFPIYRLYENYFRLNKIDNFNNTMYGIYSGSIDTSKSKIDVDTIHWGNIIKI